MKFTLIPAVALVASAMVLTGCAQSEPEAGAEVSTAAVAEDFVLPDEAPDGYKEGLKVALVRQSGVGDYFEQWGSGFEKQIDAAGGELSLFDARGDNSEQVTQFTDAMNSSPDVIVVDHGLADSLNPKIDAAIEAGIPVVVYDVAISNKDALYISQDDESLAGKILDQIKTENPDGGKIAYVNVSGIAPLDTRDGVYKSFLSENPSFTEVAHFGKYSESAAADTAVEGAAALTSAPDTSIVFAAYDELAKGALIALRQNNMLDSVSLYGVDISTADIGLMTEEGSPWKATAATDPANVGAIVARGAIAAGSGIDMPSKMVIPASLITQKLLLDEQVTNMDELRVALPELSTPDYLGAAWIPEAQ